MTKRWLTLPLPILTLILEIVPYGAVCCFARPGGEDGGRELYSYFDLLPFGYANFAPFLTAVLTCVLLLTVVFYCVTGKRRAAAVARAVLFIAAILSLAPLTLGIRYFSAVGAVITVFLAAELILLCVGKNKKCE